MITTYLNSIRNTRFPSIPQAGSRGFAFPLGAVLHFLTALFLGLLIGLSLFASPARAASPNDNIANAVNLLVNFSTVAPSYRSTHTATTTGDSAEGSEPSGCKPISKSVWYKYYSSATFNLNAETVGSNYDTVLTVWKGTDTNTAVQGLITPEVACDDDGGGSLTSKLTNVTLAKGSTYFFQVSAFGSS